MDQKEKERVRKIIMEAQMIQMKRTTKALTFVTIVFFAVEGIVAIYRFFT